MKKEKALVIFSGGQDSTTCLYSALSHFKEVEAISFFYAQKHHAELTQANKICRMENVKHKVVDISFLGDLVQSALIDHSRDISQIQPNGLPASFVPNRNALMITIAHAYAQTIGADALITGVCQTDYSGYPDCRDVFIDEISDALNRGSGARIPIRTPLMYLTKAETFSLAEGLGALDKVIELSHTCYNGDRSNRHDWGYGCGTCPACLLRAKGYKEFREAKIIG